MGRLLQQASALNSPNLDSFRAPTANWLCVGGGGFEAACGETRAKSHKKNVLKLVRVNMVEEDANASL